MSNLWGESEEEFRDIPDEVGVDANGRQLQSPPASVKSTAPARQPAPAPQVPAAIQGTEYDVTEVLQILDEEEDFSEVLNDANLRIEQGRLYQMIMNHNLFEGMDADERAVQNVQKEIRKFAKERMEIMLGMRQEKISTSLKLKS